MPDREKRCPFCGGADILTVEINMENGQQVVQGAQAALVEAPAYPVAQVCQGLAQTWPRPGLPENALAGRDHGAVVRPGTETAHGEAPRCSPVFYKAAVQCDTHAVLGFGSPAAKA